MTTMVERMARAMEQAQIGYSMTLTRLVDGESTYSLTYSDGESLTFVGDETGNAIDRCYAHIANKKRMTQAIAALREMREPTEEMIDAAYVAADDYEAAPEPKAWSGLHSAFRAMIDADIAAHEASQSP